MQLMKFLDDKKNPALFNVLWIVLDTDGSDYLGEYKSSSSNSYNTNGSEDKSHNVHCYITLMTSKNK